MTSITLIVSAWLLALLVVLPGWVWRSERQDGLIVMLARAMGLSLVVQLPGWLALAEMGCLSRFTIMILAFGWTAAGVLVFRKQPFQFFLFARLLAITGFVFSIVAILPAAGEWIAGGWDPGVIMNQGMWIGRTGTLHPPPDVLAPIFAADSSGFLTRELSGLREAFPGIPVNPVDGAWSFSFYRGTPLWIAVLYLLGGPDFALRATLIMALMTLLLLSVVISRFVPGKYHIGLAGAALLIQPIFVYYMRTPGFEMMQLFLVSCTFVSLGTRVAGLRYGALLFIGFCLLVNHVSFILFGGLLALCIAIHERLREESGPGWSGVWLAFGIWLGWAYVYFFSPASVAKLGHVVPMMLNASILLSVLTVLTEVYGRRVRAWGIWILPIGLAMGCAIELCRTSPFQEFAANANAVMTMNGIVLCAVGLAGCVWFYVRRADWRWMAAFLVLCLFIVLQRKHTVDLYPWALKRFLPFLIPLVAIGFAFVLSLLWKNRFGKFAALVLVGVVAVENHKQVYDAARHVEFSGLLSRIHDIAGYIPDDSVIIADHFKWGTPLAAIHGRQVINGERIWSSKSEAFAREAMQFIHAHLPPATPIYWITVTDVGLNIYPGDIAGKTAVVHAFDPIPLTEGFHHRKNRAFWKTRTFPVQFTIHRTIEL